MPNAARNVARGLGGSLMALAVGLFASGWPEHVRAHPYLVLVAFLVGTAIMAIGFLPAKPLPKEQPTGGSFVGGAVSGDLSQTTVGRDVYGDMMNAGRDLITAGRDVITGDVHHHYPQPEESPRWEVRGKEVPLKISFASQNVVYHQSPGAWFSAEEYIGEPRFALIAWINNPVAPKGQIPVEMSSISAHIRFWVEDHWEMVIPRAYWIGHTANMVDIPVGQSAGVLIGMVRYSHWASFENPFTTSRDQNILQLPVQHRPLRKESLMPIADMHGDLSLLSSDGRTLEQRRFVINFAGNMPHASIFPADVKDG
jgi:hypothetical protein